MSINRSVNRSINVTASPKNTLLNYFSKSPSIQKENGQSSKRINDLIRIEKKPQIKSIEKDENDTTFHRKMDAESVESPKNGNQEQNSSDEDVGVMEQRRGLKRRRFVLSTSEEESDTEKILLKKENSDYTIKIPVQKKKSKRVEDTDNVDVKAYKFEIDEGSNKDSHLEDEDMQSEEEEQDASNDKHPLPALTFQQRLDQLQKTNAELAPNSSKKSLDKIPDTFSNMDEPTIWPHQKLEFLKPDKIKDKEGRRPDHPDYDNTTLYVPKSFLDAQSPV